MWPHKRGSVSRVYTDKHASRGYHHQPVVGTLVPKSFIPSTFPEVLQCFRAGPSKGSAKSYTTYRSPVHTTWKVQGLLCVEPEHSETSCLLVLRQVASVPPPPSVRSVSVHRPFALAPEVPTVPFASRRCTPWKRRSASDRARGSLDRF